MQPELRFKCPDCGGSSFGSMTLNPQDQNSLVHRYCHGNDARDGRDGCKFDWPEQDDWKYFQHEGRALTQTEYDAIMEQIRLTPSVGAWIPPRPI